jgi:pimeloyl-ACP methyl ester carboxylesterase
MKDQQPAMHVQSASRVSFTVRAGGRRVATHRLAEGEGQRTLVLCHAAPSLTAGDADGALLATPDVQARLAPMLEAAFAQGVMGLASDIAGYCLQPWGFEPAAVQAKTLLLYGARDASVSTRHGSWWQKQLPNARLEVVPNAGHLLIFTMWQRALSHLAPGAKRQG